MIGVRELVTVQLQIDFEMLVGELNNFDQNSIDVPLEKLIAMWSDYVVRSRVYIRQRELLEDNHANKRSERTKASVR